MSYYGKSEGLNSSVITLFNLFKPNELFHPYQLDESIFILGQSCGIFHLFSTYNSI